MGIQSSVTAIHSDGVCDNTGHDRSDRIVEHVDYPPFELVLFPKPSDMRCPDMASSFWCMASA